MTGRMSRQVPGVLLCVAVSAVAAGLEAAQRQCLGRAWLESLVTAILLGALVRTVRPPKRHYQEGIDFSGRILLEIAVALLGLSVSAEVVASTKPALIGGIAVLVVLAITTSYAIGRRFGLSRELAMLIACGNSICGNTAIAAAAPVIGAKGNEVATSIAFTAVLGVIVILTLPLIGRALGFDAVQYGIFAGLTVYAVPQVIAATAPVAALSVQIGTLVKLLRVLMLAPVIVALSLGAARRGRPRLQPFVPWFIVAFLGLAGLRSTGFVPAAVLAPASSIATLLTVVSMAALGLCVDVRMVAKAGLRVTSVVVLSLMVLGVASWTLVCALGTT